MFHLFTPDICTLFTLFDGQIRLVGGCVRDSLLNHPFSDIDLCTPLPPDQGKTLLEKAGIRVLDNAIAYGTLTAIFPDHTYQITTLRQDIDPKGRTTDVQFIDSYKQDAFRRDFTINALSVNEHQVIYDYTGGFSDLETRTIRFIGDPAQRIQEDFLRILRFFRFWALYGKTEPDPKALEACTRYKDGLIPLSQERKKAEFFKILGAPKVLETLALMDKTRVLDALIPGARLSPLKKALTQDPDLPVVLRGALLTQDPLPFPLTREEKKLLKTCTLSSPVSAHDKKPA